jgi:hypothetical protein
MGQNCKEVMSEIVNYFSNHFSAALEKRPTLDGICFRGFHHMWLWI